jgi:hypothetical protein
MVCNLHGGRPPTPGLGTTSGCCSGGTTRALHAGAHRHRGRNMRENGLEGCCTGHRSSLLPVPREEYLSLDVVAFEATGDRRWRFPVAVFELENSLADDRVAYSLWKVLCVRSQLRVVFCYRQDAAEGSKLVRHLSAEVARAMEIPERTILGGDTLVVVGSRDETTAFPYGFFKDWLFDANLGRFGRP